MNLPKKIHIRELGPREGFQTLEKIVPTPDKLELIAALAQTGVTEIEVASFVKAEKVPQMADAEAIVAALSTVPGVTFKGLYLNRKGYERVASTKLLSRQGWVNVAASETFLSRNANTSLSQILSEIPGWAADFKKAGEGFHGVMLSTAFGCNYEGAITLERVMSVLASVYDAAANAGAAIREVCLADTMGWGTPTQVRSLIAEVRKKYPGLTISLHFHDTRGTAMANVYAGLQAGIEIFESSVGGMGGCPFAKGAAGNVCTEDLVFMCEEMGVGTAIDLKRYVEAAKLAERIVGAPLPGKLYKTAQKVDFLTLRKR